MAWDAPGACQYSFPAEVDLSNAPLTQFTAVAIGPSTTVAGQGQGNAVIKAYASGANFIGTLQNAPKLGEAGTVMVQGFSRCIASGTWAAGDSLSVGANGQLQKAGSSDTVFAIACESAVAGDCSTCLLK